MITALLVTATIAASFALLLRALRLGDAPWKLLGVALAVGACSGLVILVGSLAFQPTLIVIAAAALLSCLLTHQEDATIAEGALLGMTTASAAATAVLLDGSRAGFPAMAALITGTVAGAAWNLPERRRFLRFLAAVISTACVIAAASRIERLEIDAMIALPSLTGAIAFVGLLVFVLRMRALRPILFEEAEYGIVEPDLVRHLVSAWRRIFRPRDLDHQMWREIARTAHRLASRRLRQRRMSAEAARVQQLEVVRLRTRMLDLQRIRAENARTAAGEEWGPEH